MFRTRDPGRAVVSALVFGGWTLFVWGGRLRNLLIEPGSISEVSRWSLVGSIAFTALGLAVVGAAFAVARWPGRSGRAIRLLGPTVIALAALTIGVWALRAVDIGRGDHSAGFIAVHLVLAVVSIGLAIVATTALRRDDGSAETTNGRLPSKRWVSL